MEKMFGASRKWWLVAAVALLVLVFVQPLSAGTETRPFMEQLTSAWAMPQQQEGSPTQCMVDRFNQFNGASKKSLGCTSNDVRLATISLWGGATQECIPGTMTTVTLEGRFVATSSIRWDVGVFIATDGGKVNDQGGSCFQDILANASATNDDLNLTSGSGPFFNGELTGGAQDLGDTCGDIEQGKDAIREIKDVTILCQDSDGNKQADVDTCTVWNNSGATAPTCVSPLEVSANTTSKCTCNRLNIGGLTTEPSLVVKKVVINDNGGTKVATNFSFQVNGGAATSFVTDPDQTPANPLLGKNTVALAQGAYSVVEPAVAGYSTTSSGCSGTILNGQTAICTITNDDKPGTLIVKKVVTNDNGGTKVATNFTFQVDGGTAIPFEADGQNDLTVDAGTYTVTEPAVSGYTTTYNNCSNVKVPNGGSATCTITNNDQAATLIVKKIVVNDNGGELLAPAFSFQVNGGDGGPIRG